MNQLNPFNSIAFLWRTAWKAKKRMRIDGIEPRCAEWFLFSFLIVGGYRRLAAIVLRNKKDKLKEKRNIIDEIKKR